MSAPKEDSFDHFDQQARAALLETYGSQLRHWATILFSSAIVFLTLYGTYTDQKGYTETIRLMLSFVIAGWPFIFLKLLWWGRLYPRVISHSVEHREAHPYICQLEYEITDRVRASWLGKRLWFLTRFQVYPPMVAGLGFSLWLNWECVTGLTARLLECVKGQRDLANLTETLTFPKHAQWHQAITMTIVIIIALATLIYPWYKFRQEQ